MDDANNRLLRNWLPAVGIAVPFLFAVMAQITGPRPSPVAAAPARPALAFDQYLVDLGPVAPSEEVRAHFDFTNRGRSNIAITELVPSCGCLQPEMKKKLYKRGESGTFVLRVQTANQNPGLKEYRVTVKYTDPEPRETDVTFRVVLPDNQVFVRPRALIVMYQSSSESTVRDIEIIDRRSRHLKVTRAECTHNLAGVEMGEEELDEEGHWHAHLKVTVPGDLPPGRAEATVRIFTDDPDYRTLRVPLLVENAARRKIFDSRLQPASATK